MALYREQGIVLRTYKLGETDRILHLLTQGRGKVRAVAKGVRKPGSRFGGRLEPFSHVDLQLYEGRKGLDIVNQVELITPFAEVRADYALSACGQTMVEAADRVAQEDQRATSLFLLLLDGLRTLGRRPDEPATTLDVYLLRLASVAGYHAALDACASCGTPGEHPVFSLEAGGSLCRVCAPPGSQPLTPAVLSALRNLADEGFDAAADTTIDPAARRAAGTLVFSYLTHHLGGRSLTAWGLVQR
jgi:DNA repair protein RecO (recombination protein O)